MIGEYIELELYFAHCGSRGLLEGWFYLDDSNSNEFLRNRIKNRRRKAIDIIAEELANALDERTTYTSLEYEPDPRNFVSDEKEARTLIDFLKQRLNGVGIIEPESCMHGKLKFFRKIIFDGLLLEDIEGVREAIKESGLNLTSEGDIRHIDEHNVLFHYIGFKST